MLYFSWEASRPLLDLLGRNTWADGPRRPTNGIARWYWRLYQVAKTEGDEQEDGPGRVEAEPCQTSALPYRPLYEDKQGPRGLRPDELDRIEVMAYKTGGYEMSRELTEQELRSVEGWLVCKGWTEEGEQLYMARVSQGLYPYVL